MAKVTLTATVLHAGREYHAGDELEVDDATAESLKAQGYVGSKAEAAKAAKAEAATTATTADADADEE